jgi:phosphoglycolate phosphatase
MIKAIIFDLDGTLVDTPSIGAVQLAAFSIERGLPSHDFDKMKLNYGHPDTQDVGWGIPLNQQKYMIDEWSVWRRTNMLTTEAFQPPLYRGIDSFLEKLSTRTSVFLATSSESFTTDFLLDKYKIDRFFTAQRTLCCVRKFGLQDKPAPDMLLHLLEENNILPHEAIMVGDTTFDIHMAQAANVKNIAITHGAHDVMRLKAANPDYLVHNVPELEALLDSLLVR